MNISIQDRPALILIDIQKGFDEMVLAGSKRNNPEAETNAEKLLSFWRKRDLPLFHIKHCSTEADSRLAEGKTGNEFKTIVEPLEGETVIKKKVNSAFIGTNLKEQLDNSNIKKIVILGLTTDHCVSTTARMAGNFGYDTFLVYDATATFDKKGIDGQNYAAEIMHDTAIASLQGEFATVVKTDQLLIHLGGS